jgi:hypothetical protein
LTTVVACRIGSKPPGCGSSEILRGRCRLLSRSFFKLSERVSSKGNRAWNAGDVKTAYAVLPDQVEYRLAATWPEARVLRSRDEVIEFFEGFKETFPDARTASHEFMEARRNHPRRVSSRWHGTNIGRGR